MSDLDQVLDAFVADVRSETRAPGASAAIKQAHHRRKVGAAVAAVAAVAVIAAGSAVAAGTLGGSDQFSPIGEPTTPSPTTVQESAEPSPTSHEALARELEPILAQAPNWAINHVRPDDYDKAFESSCSGDADELSLLVRSKGAERRTLFYAELSTRLSYTGVFDVGFSSEAHASDAAARLVENLESCTITAWRTEPIAQTGAVLASSADGVAWIQQKGANVGVLQVPTTDGPPPVGVQVEVAEWLVAYQKMAAAELID